MLGFSLLRRIVRGGRMLFALVVMVIFVTANCMAVSGAWMSGRMGADEASNTEQSVQHPAPRAPLPGMARHEPEPTRHTGGFLAISGALTVLLLAGGFAVFSLVGVPSEEEDA